MHAPEALKMELFFKKEAKRNQRLVFYILKLCRLEKELLYS